MAEDKLFNYYERQDVLPTFGNFKSAAELEAYAGLRRELFSDKLVLPPRLFRDADMLEFGPDSGENALVFASWGANMSPSIRKLCSSTTAGPVPPWSTKCVTPRLPCETISVFVSQGRRG